MSHYLHPITFKAEKYMISSEEWETNPDVPKEALRIALEANEEGIPTGIAKHPKYGWMVLMTGQGPFIVWSEVELPEVDKCPCCTCRQQDPTREGCALCWTRNDVQRWINSWETKADLEDHDTGFNCPPKGWAIPCPGREKR